MRLTCLRHRRRKQRGLARVGRVRQNPFDIFLKTHIQHFVGFVENDHFQIGNINRFAANMIHNASRRADDDLHAASQMADLL